MEFVVAVDGEVGARGEVGFVAAPIIESNVYINYYLDLQVRKNVVVTQQEISDIYEAERGKLGNITPNDAYNQIANGLLNNKANDERINVVNKIAEEYKIEDLVKENLK